MTFHDDKLWVAYSGSGGVGLGVSSFDGTVWNHYNTSNSGLPNNDIRAIAADHDGNLWFGCYNVGIVKFDGEHPTYEFSFLEFSKKNHFGHI